MYLLQLLLEVIKKKQHTVTVRPVNPLQNACMIMEYYFQSFYSAESLVLVSYFQGPWPKGFVTHISVHTPTHCKLGFPETVTF